MFQLLLLGALAPTASAAEVTCDDGSIHKTVQDALDDENCGVVALGPGLYWESVSVDRSVTIVGTGRNDSVLFCVDGPCIDIHEDAHVTMAAMSVGSTGVAVASKGGQLEMVDLRISPLGLTGGELKLRDTDTRLMNVELEVVELPAIDAVSRHGNDLDFEKVRFTGVPKRSGVRSVMYTSNYGVSCADCAFQPARANVVADLLWGDDASSSDTDRSASHPYPQLFCPEADAKSEALCEAHCGAESVALCRMTYKSMTQTCLPEAVCVPAGEVPTNDALALAR